MPLGPAKEPELYTTLVDWPAKALHHFGWPDSQRPTMCCPVKQPEPQSIFIGQPARLLHHLILPRSQKSIYIHWAGWGCRALEDLVAQPTQSLHHLECPTGMSSNSQISTSIWLAG